MTTLTIFDFDDTLMQTEMHVIPHLRHALFEFLKDELGLPEDDFIARSVALSKDHGTSIHGWASLLNKPTAWVLEAFDHTARAMVKPALAEISPDPTLNEKLRALQTRGHTLAILTHGHKTYIQPTLAHLGISAIIPSSHVFDISSTNGIRKREEGAYRHVLNSLSNQVFLQHHMVEDSPANLPPAKRLGFTTWLVGHKKPQAADAPFIDHRLPTIHHVLDALLANAI